MWVWKGSHGRHQRAREAHHLVGNPHDGKTLAIALDAVARWTGQRYARVLVDKGYRGHGQVGGSAVIIPGKKVHASAYALRRHISAAQR
jgi:transposase, IS5 family